jgi:hypothetical protein
MDISLNIRKRSFSGQYDVNKCVICQENKTNVIEHKKQRGIQTLKERASQRQRIRDVRYYEAIDRLEKLHTSDEVFYHRKCYSEFTHQKQIKTFEARAEGQKVDVESPKQEHGVTCSDSMAPSTSKYSSRRSVKPVDWNLYAFFVRLPTKISCSIFQRFLSEYVLARFKIEKHYAFTFSRG